MIYSNNVFFFVFHFFITFSDLFTYHFEYLTNLLHFNIAEKATQNVGTSNQRERKRNDWWNFQGMFWFFNKKKNEKRKKKKTGRSNFLNIQRVIVFWFFMFYLFTFFFWLQNFDANFIFVTPTHKNLICSERQKVR